jgi:hypothetical protein
MIRLLIQGETYTMSDVRIGSTFFKSSTSRSVGTVKKTVAKKSLELEIYK